MIEFLLTFVILLAIVAAMSIGVMRGRNPISGSCGGLNNLGIDGECEICGGDAAKCEEQQKDDGRKTGTAFYDAS
ncbi:MAG: (Na+)-NQR maturation NqrM [Pseudomonadales bacterium]|nr:(Na+)-NQR maturation NqrM [Pseudomonadales bacterium]